MSKIAESADQWGPSLTSQTFSVKAIIKFTNLGASLEKERAEEQKHQRTAVPEGLEVPMIVKNSKKS